MKKAASSVAKERQKFLKAIKSLGKKVAFFCCSCYNVVMSIYAIGDLHLSFDDAKPMDVFGRAWAGHFDKIRAEIDRLEEVVDDQIWTLPKYREMLFIK